MNKKRVWKMIANKGAKNIESWRHRPWKIKQNHGTVINFRGFHTCTLDATIGSKIIEKRSQNPSKSIKKHAHFDANFCVEKLTTFNRIWTPKRVQADPKINGKSKKKSKKSKLENHGNAKNAKNAKNIEIWRPRPWKNAKSSKNAIEKW